MFKVKIVESLALASEVLGWYEECSGISRESHDLRDQFKVVS